MPSSLSFTRLDSPENPLVRDWKRLYLSAFPPNERMSWAFFERTLSDPESDQSVIAVSDAETGEFLGLTSYQETTPDTADRKALFVWYLAVTDEHRSQGIGTQVLTELRERAVSSGCSAILLEVAIPEAATEPGEAMLDRRRIRFYERAGFYRLDGVHYLQGVDAQDGGEEEQLTPMFLMVLPVQAELSATDLFEMIHADLGDSVTRIGDLSLVRLPGC